MDWGSGWFGKCHSLFIDIRSKLVHRSSSPRISQSQDTDSILATVFALTTEQTRKIPVLGDTKSVVTFYSTHMLCQGSHGPLVITLIASVESAARPGTSLMICQVISIFLQFYQLGECVRKHFYLLNYQKFKKQLKVRRGELQLGRLWI